MENASKALLIAGGIFLAMIIASMLFLLSNNIQSFTYSQSKRVEQEEIEQFNMQFEAYNKKIMYGTDVISVVNKAIANNNLIDVQPDPTSAYYVNIQFTINEDMVETQETIIEKLDGTEVRPKQYGDTIKLSRGTYKLGQMAGDGTLEMSQDVLNFFSEEARAHTSKTTNNGEITTIIINPAIINFKRAVFTCTNVHYNENSGRIDSLTFTQVQEK